MAVGTKRRNSEKRKEKSRDAARSRRGKESEIFNDLASQLPMSTATIEQLDKASVMRLLLSNIKLRTIMEKRPKLEVPDEGSLEEKVDTLYPKALEGFLVVLSKDGDFIFVSETVSKYLGMQQIDLMGQSIYDFTHPCDHDDIQDMLVPARDGETELDTSSIFVRLKCTLTSKGRNVNLKSASYKVVRLTGKYIADDHEDVTDDEEEGTSGTDTSLAHLVAVAETVPHPSNIEVPLDKRSFSSRHSMNMRFTDCDDKIKRLIGYQHDELIGQSFFAYHHAMDSKMMEKAFKDLFSKGQTTTGQYRFLAKNGGYVWMVTQATVIHNSRTQKAQCVVCVHYVLSHVEQHGRVLAGVQMPTATPVTIKKEEPARRSQCNALTSKPSTRRRECRVEELFHVPMFSTEEIFRNPEEFDRDIHFSADGKKSIKSHDLAQLTLDDSSVPALSTLKEVESYGTDLNLYDDFARIDHSDFKNDLQVIVSDSTYSTESSCNPSNTCSRTTSGANSPNTCTSGAASPAPRMECLSTINPTDIRAMEGILSTVDANGSQFTDSIDFENRAPFVHMNDDMCLQQPTFESLLHNLGTDFDPGVFGSTEAVFDEDMFSQPSAKKQSAFDMLEGSTVKASIEQAPDMKIMKKKRSFDRSCLEKGPPAKMVKYFVPAVSPQIVAKATKEHSVLMNLLLKGEDKDHGYSVNKTDISGQTAGRGMVKPGMLRHLLTEVTNHECELNAPANARTLLEGQELVTALDIGSKTSFAGVVQ